LFYFVVKIIKNQLILACGVRYDKRKDITQYVLSGIYICSFRARAILQVLFEVLTAVIMKSCLLEYSAVYVV
jgi:hypothetical protein